MSCKFHDMAATEGTCADCGQEFCAECEVPVKRHGSLCLTCAATFAGKKIIQSYIAIGLGVAFGFFVIKEIGLFAPVLYGYFFFAVFWGWHYGGKVWLQISRGLEALFSGIPVLGGAILISIRLMFASIVGSLGGGIAQFIRSRKITRRYGELSAASQATAA